MPDQCPNHHLFLPIVPARTHGGQAKLPRFPQYSPGIERCLAHATAQCLIPLASHRISVCWDACRWFPATQPLALSRTTGAGCMLRPL
ncbi:hypothetical protein HNY73_000137 [Argiope bruennichi]|uniref:Uncharacterized protein n=1 Tax=Argiope bruennichi TaxID=94029 RepID=A0A8T0FZH7_ARGBR|nr:hypothetical protein HNY73_000137 [Argiope bruennichi]